MEGDCESLVNLYQRIFVLIATENKGEIPKATNLEGAIFDRFTTLTKRYR